MAPRFPSAAEQAKLDAKFDVQYNKALAEIASDKDHVQALAAHLWEATSFWKGRPSPNRTFWTALAEAAIKFEEKS